ncbi:unnamed protein product [Brassicogethes aeneus]|uniref:Uncharacterized protein n=1 Tax=Brassicogethes aeneus TaxID=1431903 RepID=A0A9P0B916_BRAAE|nr:unnamed protein product [Brassicogethes aeneus]
MGKFWPACVAFVITCTGTTVFREPDDTSENGPLASCYIFMFSVFLLLWDLRVYPRTLRKQWNLFQFIIEFCIAEFIMEQLLFDFWFPLEKSLIAAIPKLGEYIEKGFKKLGQDINLECFKSDKVGNYASYTLSIFFLIAVLHATRAIDLRILECGISTFFSDTYSRFKRFMMENTPRIFTKERDDTRCNKYRNHNYNQSVMMSNYSNSDFSDEYDELPIDFEYVPCKIGKKDSYYKRYRK